MARDFEESPSRGTERCPGPGWAELCELMLSLSRSS